MEKSELIRLPLPDTSGCFVGLIRREGVENTSAAPVLLVHGATFGAALFDLPRPGYSLMAALAKRRPVYALDVRGYGHSRGGSVMDSPSGLHPPFAAVDEAVLDIGAAVDFIVRRHGIPQLDLVGFSWGTITASRFAGANAHRISRLALYAPIYREVRPLWRGEPPAGAYRTITLQDVIERWNADLAPAGAMHLREAGIAEFLFDTVAALDPLAEAHAPSAFRCPNGALADLAKVAAGQALFDPSLLTMPVLLIRGDNDVTSTDADARRLLAALPGSDKCYRVVEAGSHFLCIERNRQVLYDELDGFLERQRTPTVT